MALEILSLLKNILKVKLAICGSFFKKNKFYNVLKNPSKYKIAMLHGIFNAKHNG